MQLLSSAEPESETGATRHLLAMGDFGAGIIDEVIEDAASMKAGWTPGSAWAPLAGRAVALIFEKPSLRTRVSFEVGIARLGGTPLIIDATTTHFGRGEAIGDAAKVVSRYVDAIVIRSDSDARVAELAAGASVPVVNA